MWGRANRAGWAWPAWRLVRAPLLMLATILLITALRQSGASPSDPSLLYALVIIVVAVVDGRRAPLLAGLVLAAYLAYAPAARGVALGDPDAREMFALAALTLVASVLVGGLSERGRQLRVEVAAERERAQRALVEKTDFMNAAAHELRTPLTVIVGYLSMLREGSFGPPSARWSGVLEAVAGKAHELSRLTDQMLLSARLDTDTAPTAAVVFDLREAVERAVERVDPRATLLDASVTFQLPYRPVLTYGDPDHVGIILDNLIENALEHSREKPWVKVTVLDDGDPKVLVEDRGRGVPPEMRERIFERFVRGRDEAGDELGGPGLGLSISRDLAGRLGGSLARVRSEPNLGSVFALRLPPAVSHPASADRLPD